MSPKAAYPRAHPVRILSGKKVSSSLPRNGCHAPLASPTGPPLHSVPAALQHSICHNNPRAMRRTPTYSLRTVSVVLHVCNVARTPSPHPASIAPLAARATPPPSRLHVPPLFSAHPHAHRALQLAMRTLSAVLSASGERSHPVTLHPSLICAVRPCPPAHARHCTAAFLSVTCSTTHSASSSRRRLARHDHRLRINALCTCPRASQYGPSNCGDHSASPISRSKRRRSAHPPLRRITTPICDTTTLSSIVRMRSTRAGPSPTPAPPC
ncbi:hypothetical protein B0H19DRAFT_1268516 [Mycena capillaripes]|nr:hypothetical protein B0H19DRAFT_1268516 [Mycena capillaripes]